MPQASLSKEAAQPPKKNPSVQRTPQTAAPAAQQSAPNAAQSIHQLQRSYGNRAVQRLIQRAQAKSDGQASIGLEGGQVDNQVQRQINAARGGGHPLDKNTSGHFGSALGADFSGVRVHTDSTADHLNRSLSAKAFTTGSDIFFSHGTYAPGSQQGQQLLAHELTHVVQQGGGQDHAKANKVQTKLTVGPASDKFEQQADRVASTFGQAGLKPQTGPTPGLVQRKPQKLKNQPQDVTSLQGRLRPLGQSTGPKDYGDHLWKIISDFSTPIPNLDPAVQEAALDYLKAQRVLFRGDFLGGILHDKYAKKYTDKEGNEKRKPTSFGPVSNTAARGVNWSAGKMGKHKNWKDKKGVRKTGSAIAFGLSKAAAFLSVKALQGLTKARVKRTIKSSSAFLDVKDAYDALAHVFGNQLAKSLRPDAVLEVVSTSTGGSVATALEKQTFFQKLRLKRKQKQLRQDMGEQDLPGENEIAPNNDQNVQDDLDSEIDEDI